MSRTVFLFNQAPWLLIVRLLFEDSVSFIGKPADTARLIDTGSSTRRLSILLSAVETSFRI